MYWLSVYECLTSKSVDIYNVDSIIGIIGRIYVIYFTVYLLAESPNAKYAPFFPWNCDCAQRQPLPPKALRPTAARVGALRAPTLPLVVGLASSTVTIPTERRGHFLRWDSQPKGVR